MIPHETLEIFSSLWWQTNLITIGIILLLLFLIYYVVSIPDYHGIYGYYNKYGIIQTKFIIFII